MRNPHNSYEDLKKYTVAIQRPSSEDILGTGIIVTDDGLMLTCFHVIGDIKIKYLKYRAVDVYSESIPEIKLHAKVIEEYCNQVLDIAFLQLEEKLPKSASPANLSETIDPTHKFQSFGFRKPKEFKGLNAAGEIRGTVRKKSDEVAKSYELIQLHCDEIGQGMSGAAVLDKEINKVVGIISEHYVTQTDIDRNLSFAIPVKSMIAVYPMLKGKNPGLCKVAKQLNETWIDDETYNHSKEIGKIIFEGWHSSHIFCRCEYEYGKVKRVDPKEPVLENIGLARQHFESGYKDLWNLKEKAKSESVQICNSIEQEFNLFEEMIYSEIEKEFSDTLGQVYNLIRKGLNFSPSSDEDRVYIDVNIIDSIFRMYDQEIQIGEPVQIQVTTSERGTFPIFQLTVPKGIMGYGDKLSMDILLSRFRVLLTKTEVHSFLSEYSLLQQWLECNTKINKTLSGVQDIWKDIYQNSESIRGSCKRCPRMNQF